MTTPETNTVPSTTIEDVDLEAFERYLRRHVPRLAVEDVPHEDALMRLRLAAAMGSRITPTVAGLYLFGREPQFVMPNLAVVAAKFDGTEITDAIVAQSHIAGPLPELIEQSLSFVKDHARELVNQIAPESGTLEFPMTAVTEALANALVHRDLRSPGQVAIRMFDGRLEIWSPGAPSGLPEAIDVYARRGGVSLPRNPLVAIFARQFGFVEQLGRGLVLMSRVVREEAHGEVEVIGSKEGVLVSIPSAIAGASRRTSQQPAN